MDRQQIEPIIEDLPVAEATPAEAADVKGGLVVIQIISVLVGHSAPATKS